MSHYKLIDLIPKAAPMEVTLTREHRDAVCRETQMAEAAPELYAALRQLLIAPGSHCFIDVLNPCWDARPNDVVGKHWGGGSACEHCTARAVLAKAGGS